MRCKWIIGILSWQLATIAWSLAPGAEIDGLVEAIRQVGPKGAGHREARQAWQELSRADASQLTRILAGMDGAEPLAINWLRAAVDTVAERALREKKPLPLSELEKFLADTRHAPRARRAAYEWIVRVDSTASDRLIPGFLNDASLELRRDAVSRLFGQAEKESADKGGQIKTLRTALSAARDVDQIKQATEKLKALGENVDLPTHFGFVRNWRIIGPFDNTSMKGFQELYPPEVETNLAGRYPGKLGDVSWSEYESTHEFGIVDLTKALDKHKGAVAYAVTTFVATEPRAAQIRIGTSNANKVWLNGELLTANEVYHLGQEIDQYVAPARLKQGENTILVKICQNEQTEDWAQKWEFQLRVCDEVGTAILPAVRKEL